MSSNTAKIIKQALDLPREGRAYVAEKLIESLDYEEAFEISPEWKKEIQKRCEEIDQGKVELIPDDQIFAEIERKLS